LEELSSVWGGGRVTTTKGNITNVKRPSRTKAKIERRFRRRRSSVADTDPSGQKKERPYLFTK